MKVTVYPDKKDVQYAIAIMENGKINVWTRGKTKDDWENLGKDLWERDDLNIADDADLQNPLFSFDMKD